MTTLKDRVRVLRPMLVPPDPASRFYRGHYDAQTLDAFPRGLRDQVDLDTVGASCSGSLAGR